MATPKKKSKKSKADYHSCFDCGSNAHCCQSGTWVDLEEAKNIAALGLKGEFFQLEIDKEFPSGFRIGTSYHENPCTFLDSEGLCAIHKVGFHHKPHSCKEFPFENGGPAPYVDELCPFFKTKLKKKKLKKK